MKKGKLEVKRIENDGKRLLAFKKRCAGLLKKANQLSVLCDAQVSVIVFSSNGQLFDFSSSNMKQIFSRYLKCTEPSAASGKELETYQEAKEVKILKEEIAKLESKQLGLLGKDLNGLSLGELQQLESLHYEGLLSVKERKEMLLKEKLEQSRLQGSDGFQVANNDITPHPRPSDSMGASLILSPLNDDEFITTPDKPFPKRVVHVQRQSNWKYATFIRQGRKCITKSDLEKQRLAKRLKSEASSNTQNVALAGELPVILSQSEPSRPSSHEQGSLSESKSNNNSKVNLSQSTPSRPSSHEQGTAPQTKEGSLSEAKNNNYNTVNLSQSTPSRPSSHEQGTAPHTKEGSLSESTNKNNNTVNLSQSTPSRPSSHEQGTAPQTKEGSLSESTNKNKNNNTTTVNLSQSTPSRPSSQEQGTPLQIKEESLSESKINNNKVNLSQSTPSRASSHEQGTPSQIKEGSLSESKNKNKNKSNNNNKAPIGSRKSLRIWNKMATRTNDPSDPIVLE